MAKSTCRDPQKGISLLEIMVVLAIIALIVGLAGPRVVANFGRAKSLAAEVQLSNVQNALQLFYIDAGRYPTENEGLEALLQAPAGVRNWRGPYIDRAGIIDPWSRELNYRFPGNEKAFDLYTLGRDGHLGGNNEDRDIYL